MRSRGYTLVEILAVLAILGIAIALAQIRLAPSPAQALEREARRLGMVKAGERAYIVEGLPKLSR